jgi:hypothetical protein
MIMKVMDDPRALFATSRELWLWPIATSLGCLLFTFYRGSVLLGDPDTLWHIAVGRWIIEHRALPFHDPFSYTFQGKLWVPDEWLSDVIFASTYKYFGWAGVCAIAALSISIALMLLTRCLMRWLEPPRPAIAAAFAFALSEGHLFARPHVFAIPLLVFWISHLVYAREEGRAPSFILLPVMTLWCNLHGSFVVGLAFCAFLGLEAVYTTNKAIRWEVARRWGIFSVCALASALLSPNGAEALFFPVRMMQMNNALAQVYEWQSPDFHLLQPLELWIGLVIFVGFSSGIRLPLTRIAMVLLLLHQALLYMRNAELVGFIAPLLVAPSLARQLPPGTAPANRGAILDSAFGTLRRAAVLSTVIAAFFISSIALFNWRGVRPGEAVAPRSALEAARAAGISGRVFNDYNFGAFLVFEGIPALIDGRAQPYTDQFIAEAVSAVNGNDKALTGLLNHYDAEWTFLRPKTAAVGLLDHYQNWKRIYVDDYAVIHQRIR